MKQTEHRSLKVLTVSSFVLGLGLVLTAFDGSSYDFGGLALGLIFVVSPLLAILTILTGRAANSTRSKPRFNPSMSTSNAPPRSDNSNLYLGIFMIGLGVASAAGWLGGDHSFGSDFANILFGYVLIFAGVVMMVYAAAKSK